MTLLSTLMNVADQLAKNKTSSNSAVPRKRKRKVRKAVLNKQGTGWDGLQTAFSQPIIPTISQESRIARFERRTERLQRSNDKREKRINESKAKLKKYGF